MPDLKNLTTSKTNLMFFERLIRASSCFKIFLGFFPVKHNFRQWLESNPRRVVSFKFCLSCTIHYSSWIQQWSNVGRILRLSAHNLCPGSLWGKRCNCVDAAAKRPRPCFARSMPSAMACRGHRFDCLCRRRFLSETRLLRCCQSFNGQGE